MFMHFKSALGGKFVYMFFVCMSYPALNLLKKLVDEKKVLNFVFIEKYPTLFLLLLRN